MCNYFNNYDNLNGCMLITFGVNFQNCAAIKKKVTGFKAHPYPNIMIPLANWTSYASILK
jgi:hypothetical protein